MRATAARIASARRPACRSPAIFSALKLRWLLDNVADARRRAEAGELAFGTIDSWLLWHFTGRHLTDVTNASRTQLMNLATLDGTMRCSPPSAFRARCCREIVPSSSVYGATDGGVPIAGILGDQQAALMGQACFMPGEVKNTYGTGCFLLMNTGAAPVPSNSGLITTVAWQLGEQEPCYALEGSIAITGALVQWLRDNLGVIRSSAEIETLAASVPDNGDVYFVPAFSGLYAPYWRADARGIIAGLTRYASAGHIARAALEATAYQTLDVIEAMQRDSGIPISTLRVDGGMVVNALLMQFQADILGAPVRAPSGSGSHRSGCRLCRWPRGRLLAEYRGPAGQLEGAADMAAANGRRSTRKIDRCMAQGGHAQLRLVAMRLCRYPYPVEQPDAPARCRLRARADAGLTRYRSLAVGVRSGPRASTPPR